MPAARQLLEPCQGTPRSLGPAMSDPFAQDLTPVTFSLARTTEPATQGMSSLYKLFEAFIALREKNNRQHKCSSSRWPSRATRSRQLQQLRRRHPARLPAAPPGDARRESASAWPCSTSCWRSAWTWSTSSRPGRRPGRPPRRLARWAEAVEVRVPQGPGRPAPPRHPPLRRRHRLALQPGPARARRQPRMEGMDALRIAEQTRARLRQPAARVRPAPAQGDCLGIEESR